jgi:fibronectin-binding autotransporter adhesin
MRPYYTLFTCLVIATLTGAPISHAQLTWDANGAGAGQTNGGGAWLGTDQWWNGSSNQNWVSGSDAIFGGPATAGGAVTLASPTSIGTLTFNTFTGTYTLGTAGQAITLNGGITKNAGSGIATVVSPIILGAAQTWSNSSTNVLNVSAPVDNGGHTLIVEGTGNTNIAATASVISGSGGITKNGSGALILGAAGTPPIHTYTGTLTINGGRVMTYTGQAGFNGTNLGPGNVTINDGYLDWYWSGTLIRTLGSGENQIQILGGTSGFSQNGNTSLTIRLNNSNAFEVVWGSTHFSPDVLLLQASNSQNGSNLLWDNPLDLNGVTRTIRSEMSTGTGLGRARMNRVIRDSQNTGAGIIKTGTGILEFNAANTFTGGVELQGGRVRVLNNGGLGVGGPLSFTGSGTILDLQASPTVGSLSSTGTNGLITAGAAGARTLTVNQSTNTTFGGVIEDGLGTVALVKTGAGSLTLSGTNTYSGGTTLAAGTVVINNANSLGTGDVSVTGSSRINATGGITYTNNIGVGAPLNMQYIGANNGTATFSGILSGSGNLTVVNSALGGGNTATLFFSNENNTFTGNVLLPSVTGSSDIFRFNSIGDGGNFTFARPSWREAVVYSGSSNIAFTNRQIALASTVGGAGGLNGNGIPILMFQNNGAGTVTFNSNMATPGSTASSAFFFFGGSNTGDNTFAGTIAAPGGSNTLGIGKWDAGRWILSNPNNSYTGDVWIANGTLSVPAIDNAASNQPLGRGSRIRLGNQGTSGTLEFTGTTDSTTDKQVQLGNATAAQVGAGSILNNGTGTLSFTSATFNPTIAGITATRTLTLGGSNTGDNTIEGTIQNNAATGVVALTKSGAGTWVLTGNNTYTGNTTIQGGSLEIGGGGVLGGGNYTGNISIASANSGTLRFNSTASQTLAGVISGAGSLVKNNTGSLTLTNANTYSGGTTVSGGTLLVNNTTGSATGSGSVTVLSGATLGGTGLISGPVSLFGTISPGNSIGTLTTGSHTWNPSSVFEFEFSTDGSTGSAGSAWDLLAINGALDLSNISSSSPMTIDLVTMADATTPGLLASWNPGVDTLWSGFVTTTGGITGFSADSFAFNTAGFANPLITPLYEGFFSVIQNGNNLDLLYTAVIIPEPSRPLLLAAALAPLILRRRRR